MSYYDKKLPGLMPDPGDEPELSEEEEFELLRDAGMNGEEFADKAMGERYAKWLSRQAKRFEEKRLLALLPGSELGNPYALARFYSRIKGEPLTPAMVQQFASLLRKSMN